MSPAQRCRVIRGFRHKGIIQGPGTILDLDKVTASDLRLANKLEFVPETSALFHTTELPDPNRRLADRQAAREASISTTTAAARAAISSNRKSQA
jgi:hypothetical protein